MCLSNVSSVAVWISDVTVGYPSLGERRVVLAAMMGVMELPVFIVLRPLAAPTQTKKSVRYESARATDTSNA
jgi:hypothetical protein